MYKISFRFVQAAIIRAPPIIFHSLLDHQGLIGRSSGYTEELSDDVKKTIEGLTGVYAEYLAIFRHVKKESVEVVARYAPTRNQIRRIRLKPPFLIFISS